MTHKRWIGFIQAIGIAVSLCIGAQAVAAWDHPANRARILISELRLKEAEPWLQGALSDPQAALEYGKLLLFSTRYEEAARILERPDVAAIAQGAQLGQLARDSAQAVAGAFVVHDIHHDVIVRMQDDHDQPLVPFISEVIDASRSSLRQGLGVELPRPMYVELVRDHFSLAKMTGLPEDAARTTGTVAIANWGRVTMVSPRAMSAGYPWMDTLAHELTHIALGMGTRDRAPLWLQEGVAKTFEKRWRRPDDYDPYPSPHDIAAAGISKNLARDFDDLGPSVALLPSPTHALVVYAQVESFLRFLLSELGEQMLVELIPRLREAGPSEGVSEVLASMTGRDLQAWQQAWRAWLTGTPRPVPSELSRERGPDALVLRDVRLGRLLLERGHGAAAARLLQTAEERWPNDLQIRYLLAKASLRHGDVDSAWNLLRQAGPPMAPHAEAFSLLGRMREERHDGVGAEYAFFRGLSLNPWSSECACEAKPPPALPTDAARSWLCEAARNAPRY
ncbi:MAG TPA: tetratricopeptide repeat protein [Polyangiaceae bacterium]|jgi:tetratricopeptide (TPR) repeat protein|nr:MAG: hypothetical protein BWY17_00630 [Deltaproteobacteria bacterium ADurb.Bin207]HNS99675.1 tetratricopeptide repeat protein [Polyangiaceae bacterium]HNZ24497.1 tetratricopeptide repeat protein [Polyangiaceae bacterium]HOD22900.1 tetratricopeptide repeat protein [Polyangiaceae bacterium]HOE50824.1 tetratricopeptide repeat protein [Polyangiaceae bacterium]